MKLTEAHRTVLGVMGEYYEEHYQCFATIASDSRMERPEVRRIVRHLARKGFTEFAKGLWTEDGEMAGSGYRITEAGRRALEQSQSQEGK